MSPGMATGGEGPHAVIVGASVAGLASATGLARAGWRVSVLERRADLAEGGQAFLLQPNGIAALDRLGALERVRARGVEIGKVVMQEAGRTLSATYDYRELGGPHGFAIEIRPQALREALAERAAELGVPPPGFGSEVVDVIRDRDLVAGVRTRTGASVEADLVVAADGRGSQTRQALGITTRRLGAATAYVLGTVDVTRPTRDLHVYCGDGYADGVCPLADGTYFWDCVTDANRLAVEAHDLEAWKKVYADRVPSAPEFVDAVAGWDQLHLVEVRPFWSKRRLAPGALLVGDAAGAVHPHAAQGANLALEDGAALGSVGDLASLRPFARRRDRKLRRYVLWSLAAAASLDGPNAIWRAARRQNLRNSRIRPLRRLALRQQAGLG